MVPERMKRHVSADNILPELRRHELTRILACRCGPAYLPRKVCVV